MKRLKCIGGPADGKIIEVESHCLDGDIVRVPTKKFHGTTRASMPTADTLSGGPDRIEIEYYVVHALHFAPSTPLHKHGEVGDPRRWTGSITHLEYLAPADWTQEQAIRHQFEKIGPVQFTHEPPAGYGGISLPDMRKLRASRIAHQIMHIVAGYFDKRSDDLQHALEDLTDAFYDCGAEVITDADRAQAGLQPRGPDGWTPLELATIEHKRREDMLRPVIMPSIEEINKGLKQGPFKCERPGCTITANLWAPMCSRDDCPGNKDRPIR